MKTKLHKNQRGFTIIEVLIVLAIAGLIMLIVFLAVPALQRNSRNTQRSNDAARVTGAINECLTNNNGNLTSCNDSTKLLAYVDVTKNQQLITMTTNNDGSTDVLGYREAHKCDGNTLAPGGGARAFAVGYHVESRTGTVQRCVGS